MQTAAEGCKFASRDIGQTQDSDRVGRTFTQKQASRASFRAYAADLYRMEHWCLFSDMDEPLDFEGRETAGLTRYLTGQDDTALQAEMLEMFPNGPLSEVAGQSYANSVQSFRFSDISTARAVEYTSESTGFAYDLRQNTLPQAKGRMLSGGPRQSPEYRAFLAGAAA